MKNFKPNSWVLPQPVLIIGTYDKEGRPNAMNAAWGCQCDTAEVAISLGPHATTDNLEATGEFTLAFATTETMVASDYVGITSARKNPGKMINTGWQSVKGSHVNAPIFTCFPMTMECRVKEKIGEEGGGFLLIGEIVSIIADENFLAPDGKPDVEKMNLIVFDPVHLAYIQLGKTVGKAFSIGKELK